MLSVAIVSNTQLLIALNIVKCYVYLVINCYTRSCLYLLIKTYRISFLSLIFLTVVSLSGTIYGLNFKLPLAAICALALFLILYKRNIKISKLNLMLLISFLTISTYSTFMGFFHDFNKSFVIGEFIGVISPVIVLALYKSDFIKTTSIKNTLLFAATVYSFFKVLVVYLISNNTIFYFDFYDFIYGVFGYQIVSMMISPEYQIIRLYIVNDLIITFIPLLLFKSHLSKKIKTALYILFCLSMFISYSRFLIVVFLVITFLSFSISFKLTAKKVVLGFYGLGFSTLYFLMFGLPQAIKDRFSLTNDNNKVSDGIRSIQFHSIVEMINQYLFFGAGLGSSNPNLPRTNYVYELQWLSLVFKFGLPMFFIVLTIITLYFVKNYQASFKSVVIFLLMLSSGLFNPYLESTVMGVCLLMLLTVFGRELSYTRSSLPQMNLTTS